MTQTKKAGREAPPGAKHCCVAPDGRPKPNQDKDKGQMAPRPCSLSVVPGAREPAIAVPLQPTMLVGPRLVLELCSN